MRDNGSIRFNDEVAREISGDFSAIELKFQEFSNNFEAAQEDVAEMKARLNELKGDIEYESCY